MKDDIIVLALTIAIAACWIVSVNVFSDKVVEEQDRYKANIYQKIVMNEDTLMVVDYSTLNSTYTLSNGVKVSMKFVEAQIKGK